jgi:hypothetical protein
VLFTHSATEHGGGLGFTKEIKWFPEFPAALTANRRKMGIKKNWGKFGAPPSDVSRCTICGQIKIKKGGDSIFGKVLFI